MPQDIGDFREIHAETSGGRQVQLRFSAAEHASRLA